VLLMFVLAHFGYGMPWPATMGSIFLFLTLGILAFRAIGMILAAVANTMQEGQIMVQLVYLPMLLLSGATFPTALFPAWLLIVVQFLPATYLVSGLQGMMLRDETIMQNGLPTLALALTIALGLLIASKLFRWEKEEKIRAAAKFWVLGVMLPFVVLGAWQAHSHQSVDEARILARQIARSETYLIRGARIFTGDGKVIDSGSVLVRNGQIAAIYDGYGPDPDSVKATVVEAAGKTLLPGLIDLDVHLAEPGGFSSDLASEGPSAQISHHLAAYLYSGVTAVRSNGDPLNYALKTRQQINAGLILGAEMYTCGPVFAAKESYGAEYFGQLSENLRKEAEAQFVRTPNSLDEARQQVDDLKAAGVDCIEVFLSSGESSSSSLSPALLNAIVAEAHARSLSVSVHTSDVQEMTAAVTAGADSIQGGTVQEAIPDALFSEMAQQHVSYDPSLSEAEARKDVAAGNADLLQRSLVQQVGPTELLEATANFLTSPASLALRQQVALSLPDLNILKRNLIHAYQHGVTLVTGSGAGELLVVHGPTVQHEIELWSWAGLPPQVSLEAATRNAALFLHAGDHLGAIRIGNDADLLLVDGNPLEDVSALERVSAVFFKGERIDRSQLFAQDF
jgi:imidazolonepropionase-like amidohydrolase